MKVLGCLLSVFLGMALAVRGEEFALVQGGKPLPIRAQAGLEGTASALAGYLKQMSGREFEVVRLEAGALPEGPAIVLKVADGSAPRLGGDSFSVRTEGNRLLLVGETPLAAGFAAFAFLEGALGCRWWSFDEEEVPRNEALKVGALDRSVKAPFRQATLFNREAQDAASRFDLKSRSVSTEQFTGNHTLYPLLKEAAAKRPEFFPMDKEGKRAGNDLHFCYLAPGIDDALADALGKLVEEKKGNVKDWIYFAGMGDWYGGMCLCEACKKAYEEEAWTAPDGKKTPGYSGTLVRMMNSVGEKLEKKHPGIRVGTFAYMSIDAPPGKTRPRENVVIWMPHLRYCVAHPLGGCDTNRSFQQKLEGWLKLAPGRVYVWDYGANFGDNFLYPFPVLRSMGENLRAYGRLGCAGVMVQGNYVSKGGDLAVLKNHAWRRLMWDPKLDVDRLVAEFCDGYYGPASKALQRYVFLLEDAAGKAKDFHEFTEFKAFREVLLTPALQRELRQALDEARKAAGAREPYARRVREAAVSMEAVDLIAQAAEPRLLAPKDGFLAVNGAVTWPRALEMVRDCRNASFKEFGQPLNYHENFLRAQGGPLVLLKKGDLEAVVAPAQAGRIYQLSFRGRPLLRSQFLSADKKDAKAPTVFRGGFERLLNTPSDGKPACYALLHEKERQADRVAMEGHAGVGSWRFTGIRVEKAVELTDGSTLRVTGRSFKLDGQKPVPEQVTAVTDYAVLPGPIFKVEASADGAAWVPVDLAAAAAAGAPRGPLRVAVPGPVKRLRVSLPASGAVVEDAFLSGSVEKAELLWDDEAGVLTTEVTAARDENGLWPEREIKVSGLQGGRSGQIGQASSPHPSPRRAGRGGAWRLSASTREASSASDDLPSPPSRGRRSG